MQKMSFDPLKDFTYIIHIAGYQFGTMCKSDGPIKKWQDVIDLAKADPTKVTYATGGVSTSPHIGMELIAAHSGVKFTHVPMKGGSGIDCRRPRRPRHAAGRKPELAGRRRLRANAPAQDLDGRAPQALA